MIWCWHHYSINLFKDLVPTLIQYLIKHEKLPINKATDIAYFNESQKTALTGPQCHILIGFRAILDSLLLKEAIMNSIRLVILLHSFYWSIQTKDESKRGSAFAFIFGVNWLWRCGVAALFGIFLETTIKVSQDLGALYMLYEPDKAI